MDENVQLRELAFEMGRRCLGLRTRLLDRVVTHHFNEALRPVGLTTPQLNLLALIAAMQPTTAAEVSRRIGLERSTASRNLPKMRANGWLEPGRTLRLSNKGRQLFNKAQRPWREAQQSLEDELGDKRTLQLTELVNEFWKQKNGRGITE